MHRQGFLIEHLKRESAMATDMDTAPQADGMFAPGGTVAEASHPYSDDDDSLNEAEVNGNWTPQERRSTRLV